MRVVWLSSCPKMLNCLRKRLNKFRAPSATSLGWLIDGHIILIIKRLTTGSVSLFRFQHHRRLMHTYLFFTDTLAGDTASTFLSTVAWQESKLLPACQRREHSLRAIFRWRQRQRNKIERMAVNACFSVLKNQFCFGTVYIWFFMILHLKKTVKVKLNLRHVYLWMWYLV